MWIRFHSRLLLLTNKQAAVAEAKLMSPFVEYKGKSSVQLAMSSGQEKQKRQSICRVKKIQMKRECTSQSSFFPASSLSLLFFKLIFGSNITPGILPFTALKFLLERGREEGRGGGREGGSSRGSMKTWQSGLYITNTCSAKIICNLFLWWLCFYIRSCGREILFSKEYWLFQWSSRTARQNLMYWYFVEFP